jgi:serine/threonine protein kinase
LNASAPDARAAQRLKKEARYAARLHHAGIVAVFDYVVEGDACWIVMEYVPSRSLAQLMQERGPLSPQEAGSLICQIAAALAGSHGEGVVHGDVTPENILVTEDDVARLTDFGIARALWSEATQTGTTTGTVRGKPRYLAPEVARGKAPDAKADVFSAAAHGRATPRPATQESDRPCPSTTRACPPALSTNSLTGLYGHCRNS